jgi:hypothetical protein
MKISSVVPDSSQADIFIWQERHGIASKKILQLSVGNMPRREMYKTAQLCRASPNQSVKKKLS